MSSSSHPRNVVQPLSARSRAGGYGSGVLTSDQQDEVRQAFERAGYRGHLSTAPVTSDDERIFLLASVHLNALGDIRALEEELQRILRRKVWVVESTGQWGNPVAFG